MKTKDEIAKCKKEWRMANKEKVVDYERQYKLKNKEKINERQRQYRLRHREKKRCYAKQYRLKNKEKIQTWFKIHGRGAFLKKRYGLSIDDYNNLSSKNDNKCYICNKEESILNIKGTAIHLSVDHSHKTGKVRGLLCSTCNTALGKFQDSIELLQNAIDYLKKYNEQS